MPKYAEGTKSPSGKFVVQGGEWVPLEAPGEANAIAGAMRRSDPQPSDPEYYAGTGLSPNEAAMEAGKFRGDVESAPVIASMLATPMLPFQRLIGAGVGGYEGGKAYGPVGAVGGAAAGAFAPEVAGKVGGPLLRGLMGGKGGAVVKALRTLMGEAEAAAPAAETMSTTGAAAEAAVPVGKAVSRSVLPAAADAVPGGAQKTVNTIMREFAKKAAPSAKTGEKIWLKLGPDGLPLDVVTSGQAARLPQAAKTWVAKTW